MQSLSSVQSAGEVGNTTEHTHRHARTHTHRPHTPHTHTDYTQTHTHHTAATAHCPTHLPLVHGVSPTQTTTTALPSYLGALQHSTDLVAVRQSEEGCAPRPMATHCTMSQACSTLHMHYWSVLGPVTRCLVCYDVYHRQCLTWTFLSNVMAIHHGVHRYLCGYHRSSMQDQHCVDY